MRTRPLLLIDVDGVLNPYAAGQCPEGFVEHALFPGEDELVRVSALQGRWLRELTDCFELAWASSWQDQANALLGPLLGLPELPYVQFPPTPFAPAEKVPAVGRLVGDRRAAWVDDELTEEAFAWASSRGRGQTLLIAVDPALGLTHEMTESLHKFASAGPSPASPASARLTT